MTPRLRRKYCLFRQDAQSILETVINRLGLSARAYHRVLKVSRTIADLEASEEITASNIAEALQYRLRDEA